MTETAAATERAIIPPQHVQTVAAFRGWAREFGRYDDTRTINALLGSAAQLARDIEAFPRETNVVDLQPGNGTIYLVAVGALHPRAAGGLGGRHLVSLPLQHRCLVITLDGLLTPEYVKEAFGLTREDDSLLYAGLLSLVGDRRP